jgi:hypothetical protein
MKKLAFWFLLPTFLGFVTRVTPLPGRRRNRVSNRNETLVTASGEPMRDESLLTDVGPSIRPTRETGGAWR